MAVEGNPIRTLMHFDGWIDPKKGQAFLAIDAEKFRDVRKTIYPYRAKFNEYPKYEPVPIKTEQDCCCCCGCECNCSMDILGEVINLTDFTCELNQSFCFVKHQPATSVIEATQCEEYTTPLECGEYPEIGGIQRRIVKESRMHTEIVSFIKATVTKGGPWSIEVEQTDKVMTFYYRRITVELDQVCTIPDSAWQLNPTSGLPEIIDPNYEPSCIKCKLGTLDPLSGAGIKPCCTDPTSEITMCEFSVVGGKGQIRIIGTIKSLWEYEEGKCMKPALNGPTVACVDKENDKKYYVLDSHAWDDARNGRVGCLSPAMIDLGCAGETLRVRRKTWRFVPLLPEYDDDDVQDSQCVSYNKGNVQTELMETYDSRTLSLYAGETFELDYEVSLECDTDLEFDPNTQPHQILGTPVEVSGAIDTIELSADVPFYYEPQPPKCSQCALEIDIGPDTVELMEPGCDPFGPFCYYNMSLIATYESIHKRITDPLFNCLQVPSGESCDYTGTDEGIYFETNTEHKERFYANSSSKVLIYSGVDDNGDRQWYAEIEQDDHLVQIAYRRKIYIIDFGSGCFYNNCGVVPAEEPDDCGFTIPELYDVYSYPPLVGGTPSACFFESDILTTSCSGDKITLERTTTEAWSWAIGAGGYGEPTGSSCIGPLLVHPPYKDPDLFPGCLRIVDEPLIETVLPPAVLSCVVPQGIDGTFPGICGGTGFSYRKHKYILRKKSNRVYHDLLVDVLILGDYTLYLSYREAFENWTIEIDETIENFDEFWQKIYDDLIDITDDKDIPEGLLVELLKDEDNKNIGIRITDESVCDESNINFAGPGLSNARERKRQFDTTPLVNYCKDLKAGDVEWCFLEVLEDSGIRPGSIMYHETDGTIFYNKNLPDASGFFPVTGVSGSGNATHTPGRYEAAGSFTRAATPLTIRPEFFMSLGATRVVCPAPPEEA